MPYSIYIEYSFDNLVSKFIEHYFNKTENLNTDLNNLFNNPVIVTQTEGIKKYLYYKLVEEKGIVLNLKTFNLQSFFNEYLRFLYDDDIKCEPKNNRAQKEKTNTKNIIFWYLYSFFFDIAKKEGIEKNKDFEDFIVYLYKFSDLFEQYETYRDFNEWDVLRGINLNELNYEYFENLDK